MCFNTALAIYPHIKKLKSYLKSALNDAGTQTGIPFIIYDKLNDKTVGCTRFGLKDHKNQALRIWMDMDFKKSSWHRF